MSLHPYLTGQSRVKVTKNVFKTVSRLLKKMQPGMYRGENGFRCDDFGIEELIKAIRDHKSVSSAQGINFLAKIIDFGNQNLAWDVPPISRKTLALHHKSYCDLESFQDYLCLEEILKDFYSELESPIPATPEERIWQILLSAICLGTLLDKRWLKPFRTSLAEGINLSGSWLWLWLEGEPEKSRELHAWHKHKRWVADPLTFFLINRWVDKFPEDRKALKNFDLLRAIKKCEYLQKHRKIRSVGGLLKLARARAYYVLPDFLAAYADGGMPAVPVDERTLKRIMTGKRVHYPELTKTTDLEPNGLWTLKTSPEVSGKFDPEEQIKTLKRLLREDFWKKVGGPENEHATTPEEARGFLDDFLKENRGDLSQTFILLIEWAMQLLDDQKHPLEKRKKSKPLKARSVNQYLYNIGYGLLKSACNLDLIKAKKHIREMVYEDAILYKKTVSSRFNAAEQLEQFHGFLQVFHQRESVDFDCIKIEVDLPSKNVNARIITPAEFRKILALLGWGQEVLTRWQNMSIAACILGFKAGMRRSEIVSTRLVDFQDGEEPFIQVRNHELDTTKTPDSERQIPLGPLLDADELRFIRTFFAYRERESKLMGGKLLFFDPTSGKEEVSDSQLIGPIVEAMRAVTGDPGLSFHSMRHSFVTWLLFGLLLRNDFDLVPSMKCFEDPYFDHNKLKKLRLNLLKNQRLGRNYLYAAATLVGHASGSTTICHYCHSMDLLLGYFHRDPFHLPKLSVKAIQEVARVSRTEAKKFKDRKYNLTDILRSVAKKSSKRSTTEIKYLRGRIPKVAIEEKSEFLLPWETSLTEFLDVAELRSGQSEQSEQSEWLKSIPEDKADILLAAKLYQRISQLDGRMWPKIRRILSLGNYSCDKETGSLILTDPGLGKRLVETLALLGVDKERLSLVYDPNPERNNRSQKRDLNYWARSLGIGSEYFEKENLSAVKTSERGRILFNIKKSQKDHAEKQDENKFSGALFFLMQMVELGRMELATN